MAVAPGAGAKEPPFTLILTLFVLSGATGLVDSALFFEVSVVRGRVDGRTR